MNFCDACETCKHCTQHGCIPVTEPESAAALGGHLHRKYGATKVWFGDELIWPVIDETLIPESEETK